MFPEKWDFAFVTPKVQKQKAQQEEHSYGSGRPTQKARSRNDGGKTRLWTNASANDDNKTRE